MDPSRKVRYTCTTSVAKKVKADDDITDVNVTVDHDLTNQDEASIILKEAMKKLRGIEVKRTKIKYSRIIPPYAVNRLWKELNYQDLHQPVEPPQPEVIDLTPTKRLVFLFYFILFKKELFLKMCLVSILTFSQITKVIRLVFSLLGLAPSIGARRATKVAPLLQYFSQ